MAVMFAMLEPGDKIMGMNLDHGGHLTHGSPANLSGAYFKAVPYGVNDEGFIDYDEVRRIALECRPKMIVAVASAYARTIDFKKFREIADEVGAYLMVDMAHIAGLVAAGVHPSPIPYAHVTTTTTHKTLRGPRGGMILSSKEFAEEHKFNKAVFPGIQGGPLMEAPTELAPTAMGELVDSIAEYNNSANAIGFSVYYYIDQMYSKPGLRLLAVDGVTPSNETIADQSYPLCNEFYAAILQDSTQPHVYLGGEQYLLDWPQLDGKVGSILSLLNDEEQAAALIAPPAEQSESILLGEDLEPQIPGLCIVSDRYLVGGGLWGTVALIGPTRMPFQKLMPLLHTFADQLGEGMSGKRKDTPQAAAPRRTVIYKEDLE